MPALSKIFLSIALVVLTVEGAPHNRNATAKANSSKNSSARGNVAKAVYLITNDAQNSVIALPIRESGKLSHGSVTQTGGKGSNSIDMNSNLPAAPDALVSQSALTISGQSLFAVNAGSNTLTMFSIDPKDPTKLTALGQPAAIPGEFPSTVAASAKNNMVCVGTTGAKAGVSCATFSSKGLGKMDALRPFDLGQTTPPVGPLNTVSQVFFSDDETTLFTTVKGNPPANNTGFLSSFPVTAAGGCGGAEASLSTQETRSSPEGTAVLFGTKPIPGTTSLFATDASFGAAVLGVDTAKQATVLGKGSIADQAATCWVTINEVSKTAFVTDVGVNHVVEMSLEDASIISTTDLSANGDPGLIDLVSGGNFVYALSPGNGTTKAAVTVMDVSGGKMKQVQHFKLNKKTTAGKNAQGMAVLL